ncbi:cytochrome P450 [Kibdelosporangium aridum]|uniref:Cytochrome P450 n=1 Tax=Kibdelosporangium aridum TaxID=2030 RepID=A0A428ZRN7_KIBAR|nr:cytochrome P450 [Kibdelosporangium aridum]RSM90725.1 cytochrome P450 [Kibdelosporangium aridum]
MTLAADDVRGMDWDDGLECWVVSDPALARQVLNHPGFSSQTSARLCELYMTEEARQEHHALTEFLRLWFVHTDDPEHTALRKPVQRLLSPSYIRSLAPRITEIVDWCLEDLARTGDVVPSVSEAVSGRVMAHIVGVEEPPSVLHTWSQRLSAFIAAMYRRDHAKSAHEVMLQMEQSLSQESPQDTATWAMILFGGLETTASLLSSCVLAVLSDPALWAAVRAGDGVEEIVESVLVQRPPLRNVSRVVAEDFEFAGSQLRSGDLVMVSLAGGALLEDRPGCPVSERQHLIFGFGSHYCVGASLARLEAATTLRRFVQRFPDARLAENGAVWGPNIAYVGLDHLYVELGGR